jgi:transcriptional regulator with XRE-family HTH domain
LAINAAQVRMARAALQWGVRELADRAGVAPGTIVRIEAGKPAFNSTLVRLEALFNEAGVQFFVGEDGVCGVQLLSKQDPKRRHAISAGPQTTPWK